MYKVFFNDKVIAIDGTNTKQLFKSGLFYRVSSANEVQKAWFDFIEQEDENYMLLNGLNEDEIFRWFKELFKVVVAGGGIVRNVKDELLCIHRLNKWDLPKGKIEKGESIIECAVREVEEECGISNVVAGSLAILTYHIYRNPYKNNRLTFKETHWFFMRYLGYENLVPQTKEAIEKAEWINKDDLFDVLNGTYNSLLDVFELYLNN